MHLFPLCNLLAKVLLLVLAILDDKLVADFLPVVLVIREVLLDLIKRLALRFRINNVLEAIKEFIKVHLFALLHLQINPVPKKQINVKKLKILLGFRAAFAFEVLFALAPGQLLGQGFQVGIDFAAHALEG